MSWSMMTHARGPTDCVHCGRMVKQIELSPGTRIWVHSMSLNCRNQVGDLGQSCDLVAKPLGGQ